MDGFGLVPYLPVEMSKIPYIDRSVGGCQTFCSGLCALYAIPARGGEWSSFVAKLFRSVGRSVGRLEDDIGRVIE